MLTFKLGRIRAAGTVIQQTVHVSVQKSLAVQHGVDVDVVVLRCILVFGEHFAEQEADSEHESNQDRLHPGRWRFRCCWTFSITERRAR